MLRDLLQSVPDALQCGSRLLLVIVLIPLFWHCGVVPLIRLLIRPLLPPEDCR